MNASGRTRRLLRVALVATFLGVFFTVVAVGWSYFTATGSGRRSVSVGAMQPVTVVAIAGGDKPSASLLPGGTADVVLDVKNPNPYTVTLVSVVGSLSGTVSADPGHSGCTPTGVTFTNQTSLSVPIAQSATTRIDLPGASSMSTASPSGCQGATFSIPVTITVHTPG